MIIHRPEIVEEGGEIRLSACIDIQSFSAKVPNILWFKFPKSYEEYITDRADGFAVSLLPFAMAFGENMEIRGVLSPRLAHGMQKYQQIQTTWKPKLFKLVDMKHDNLDSMNEDKVRGGVGCSFSGGVDSFYTLWSHLPQNEQNPKYRISHCLIINGFDKKSDLDDTGSFHKIEQTYEPTMKKLGLQLLVSRTNILEFIDARIFIQSFGAVATASALILGRLLSRFYIASSFKFTELHPYGSHLLFDSLLSTETMETIHDGGHLTRVEKTAVISRWDETFSRLRVCSNETTFQKETNALENCCHCEKCIRTMASLDMCGALQNYTVFPNPLKRRLIRNLAYTRRRARIFGQEVINHAIKIGRKDVAFDFRYAIFVSLVLWRSMASVLKLNAQLKNHSKTYSRFINLIERNAVLEYLADILRPI